MGLPIMGYAQWFTHCGPILGLPFVEFVAHALRRAVLLLRSVFGCPFVDIRICHIALWESVMHIWCVYVRTLLKLLKLVLEKSISSAFSRCLELLACGRFDFGFKVGWGKLYLLYIFILWVSKHNFFIHWLVLHHLELRTMNVQFIQGLIWAVKIPTSKLWMPNWKGAIIFTAQRLLKC